MKFGATRVLCSHSHKCSNYSCLRLLSKEGTVPGLAHFFVGSEPIFVPVPLLFVRLLRKLYCFRYHSSFSVLSYLFTMANTKITKPRRAARGSPLRVTRRTPGSQLIQLTQDEYSELLSMVKSSNNRLELLDQNRLSAVGTPLKSADSAPETTNLDVSDRPSTSSELGTDASAYPYADDSNSQSSRAGDEAAEMAFYSIEKGLGYYYGRDIRDMVSFCIGQSIDLLACDIRSVAQTYAQTLDWDDDISDDVRAKFLDWSPYTREYIRCPRRVVFVFEAWIWHTLVDALFSKANFYKRNRGSRHAYEVLRENVLTGKWTITQAMQISTLSLSLSLSP